MKILDLEKFRAEGIDKEIKDPGKYWKELIAGLRYLGNSAWPKLSKGEAWGEWKKEDAIKYFARIVDALRSVWFPVLPKDDRTSYSDLYQKAREFMKSKPPSKEDIPKWKELRSGAIKESRHAFGKCMRCEKAPEVETIWADGRGHAWFCLEHFESWLNEDEREVISVKMIKDGTASKNWGDNKNPNVKDDVIKEEIKTSIIVGLVINTAPDFANIAISADGLDVKNPFHLGEKILSVIQEPIAKDLYMGDIIKIEVEKVILILDERDDTISLSVSNPKFVEKLNKEIIDSVSSASVGAADAGILERKTITKDGDEISEAIDLYSMYPDESETLNYTIDHHWRGKSVQTDLRLGQEGYSIGWTITDSEKDSVDEAPETLADARVLDAKDIFKINWKTGKFKKEDGLRSTKKLKEDLRFMKFEGVVKPGEQGATVDNIGVVHVLGKGRVEYGIQTSDLHEYFLSEGKLKGRLVFNESNGVWLANQPVEQEPYVLSKEAIDKGWLPPKGISALPKSIRSKVPVNLRYWETTGEEALQRRRELVGSKTLEAKDIEESGDEFVLQKEWFLDPIETKFGLEFWILTIKEGDEFWSLFLNGDPLDKKAVTGLEEKIEDPKEAMIRGNEGTEYLESESQLNPTEDSPGFINCLDRGGVTVLESKENWKRIQFFGKGLNEIWAFKRNPKISESWEMTVIGYPEEEKSSKFKFPLEIAYRDKIYTIKETSTGGLVMNK